MELFKRIANRLKEVRENHKISRKKLSSLLDVNEKTIESYEYGKRKPTFEYIEKVANHFNLHPSYLLGSNDTVYMIPKLNKLIIRYMEKHKLDNTQMSEFLQIQFRDFRDSKSSIEQFTANEILDMVSILNVKPSELRIEFFDEINYIQDRYYYLEEIGKTLKELDIDLSFPIDNQIKIMVDEIDIREEKLSKSKEIHIKEIEEMLPALSYKFIVSLKRQIDSMRKAKNNIDE